MASAPCSRPNRKEARVFSGASLEAPRWAVFGDRVVPAVDCADWVLPGYG